MKKSKYRIVEQHSRFHIEKLVSFLLWKYYIKVTDNPNNLMYCDDIKYFDTLEKAKIFIDGSPKIYHYI